MGERNWEKEEEEGERAWKRGKKRDVWSHTITYSFTHSHNQRNWQDTKTHLEEGKVYMCELSIQTCANLVCKPV